MKSLLAKIVTGGQTGVDRGALDAALDAGFPCGGWCPEGRLAEDGVIPARYPVAELPDAGYPERTRANVLGSDGTAIIHPREPGGGTRQTMQYCIAHGKPYEVIDAAQLKPQGAAEKLAAFVAAHRIGVLNIAGPRASKWPGAHDYAYAAVKQLLARVRGSKRKSSKSSWRLGGSIVVLVFLGVLAA